ncbi:universal stress protein [Haloferax sp. S1W]|uniref:universal stress protein n=1 Tax=Haloferax sp. S1W TaxID=3377110 RepID=UPI0037C84508
MYDEILLPVDGSPASEQAIPHVFGFAEMYESRVHVLFVADTEHDGVGGIVGGEVLATLEQEGQKLVDGIVERARNRDIDAVGTVEKGSPHKAILDYIADNDIDVVMMATHGRTGIERVLLGSVTERVVRTSPVPVLTVREAV